MTAASRPDTARLVEVLPGGAEVWQRGRVALVVPAMPPSTAPGRLREAVARRRIVLISGRCPCGATLDLPDIDPDRPAVIAATIEHEADCPAGDDP